MEVCRPSAHREAARHDPETHSKRGLLVQSIEHRPDIIRRYTIYVPRKSVRTQLFFRTWQS